MFYQRKCPQSRSLLCFVLYLYSKFHLEKFNAKAVRSAFLENDYLGHCLSIWSKHTFKMFVWSSFDGQDMLTISWVPKDSDTLKMLTMASTKYHCVHRYILCLREIIYHFIDSTTVVEELEVWRSAKCLLNTCKTQEKLIIAFEVKNSNI